MDGVFDFDYEIMNFIEILKVQKVMMTHIDNHLINLAYIDMLNRRMAGYFTQDTTISSSDNQNLQIEKRKAKNNLQMGKLDDHHTN